MDRLRARSLANARERERETRTERRAAAGCHGYRRIPASLRCHGDRSRANLSQQRPAAAAALPSEREGAGCAERGGKEREAILAAAADDKPASDVQVVTYIRAYIVVKGEERLLAIFLCIDKQTNS